MAYAVCSAMVDVYLEVAGHVERDLERLEEDAFARDRSPGIAQIYQLKREMVEFKRAVLPLQEPLHRLLDQRRSAGRRCARTSSTCAAGWPGRWTGWPASTTC